MAPHPRRDEIAQTAAHLMNRRGYTQTSVAELLDATGLEKGGLYHHFRSKEEISLAAFDHAHGLLLAAMAAAIDPTARPRDQLATSIDVAFARACGSELAGGCPMVRLSTDAGERHPALKARAAEAMQGFREATRALLRADPDPPADPDALGDLIVTLVEGALVVREVTGDDAVLEPVRAHLHALLSEGASP